MPQRRKLRVDRRIERILQKLERARTEGQTCPGSGEHRFRLNPPLKEVAVAAFEAKHNVRLPEEYRIFLLQAGDGGAGPYYGLFMLEDEDETKLPVEQLSAPCPLHPDMLRTDSWSEDLGCADHESCYVGTLPLVTMGCGTFAVLIISGRARGRVVYVEQVDGGPPYFMEDADFLAWYERWLDELLAGWDVVQFGYGLAGDETRFVDVMRDQTVNANRRAEAAAMLLRLPGISDGTVKALRKVLTDEYAVVREYAALALGNFRIAAASKDIRRLLQDGDPDVRQAAVGALTKLPQKLPLADCRALLMDANLEVAVEAMKTLKSKGQLQFDDLLPWLASPNTGKRHAAIYALEPWGSNQVKGVTFGALMPLLKERDLNARLHVLMALRLVADPASVPGLLAFARRQKDWGVVNNVVFALAAIGGPTVVPGLMKLAQHDNAAVRANAAHTLGKLGDARAIPVLEAMVSDQATCGAMIDDQYTSCRVGEVAARSLAQLSK